jgi:para-aminobenzoate synthetase component I
MFRRIVAPQLASVRALDLELEPIEVALRCTHLPRLVFFDSAQDECGQISLIAATPAHEISGSGPEAWMDFTQQLLQCTQRTSPDYGFPCGIAAGTLDYDGSFNFGFYENVLIFHHDQRRWFTVGEPPSLSEKIATDSVQALHFSPRLSEHEFCQIVERAQRYISDGDIYQVNLSHRFTSAWAGDPFQFYRALRHYSPAPYAAYIVQRERTILCSSPELFLQMSGRQITTRPIKGTRPRLASFEADEKSAFDLLTSPKEIAELVMITDLERNDLGKICEYGTVHVRELLKLERYQQVFHLVSTVDGTLRSNLSHADALQSCFPGGSITGAPKKRAREIISMLEPEPRGLYTGAIGYFGFNGESKFNVAIRTAIIENGKAHFHVGAGIVADSIPAREYRETLDKAAGILLAADSLMNESFRGDRI